MAKTCRTDLGANFPSLRCLWPSVAVNPRTLNACVLSFWCNSIGSSGTPLGLGRRMSPEAGAIPCHAGKVLGAEPGGCCLEGNKPLGRHLDLQWCGLQLSFLPGAEEQHFLLLSLCPKEGKGRRAALGRPPGERRGRPELAVCLHLSLHGAGSGAGPWEVQAGSQSKWAISSRPHRAICCVCTGCLVSCRSRPEVAGMGRCGDRLCGFFNLIVSLPLSSACRQVRARGT